MKFLNGLFLLFSSCIAPIGATETTLPEGAHYVPIEFGEMALRQCSRVSPEGGEPFWQPTGTQIVALENSLSNVLRNSRGDAQAFIDAERERFGDDARLAFDFPNDPSEWSREYIGYTYEGRLYIYGNVAPEFSEDRRGQSRPMIICDGGPVFFGVEYDVESQSVTRIAFNGGLGGPFLSPIIPE